MKLMNSLALPIAVATIALMSGCSPKASDSTGTGSADTVSVSDLAKMMDFHVWKISIPASDRLVKTFRLIVVKPDGTTDLKFGTGMSSMTNRCDSVLLGLRTENTTFKGHLEVHYPDGTAIGWDLNFTDAFADSWPGWSANGTLPWHDKRVKLATATKSGELHDSSLFLELVE